MDMNNTSTMKRQAGAVSLFVVIFAMLLLSVVTISFLRIMTTDQNRAAGNDLAQSAYDSALAGVEDAKRALVWYTQECAKSSAACAVARDTVQPSLASTTSCNAGIRGSGVITAGDGDPDGVGEIKVQQSTSLGDAALDQAYTCVTMTLDGNYEGSITANQSTLVPLKPQPGKQAKRVAVEWFTKDDLVNGTGAVLPDGSTDKPRGLFKQTTDGWPANRPSVLRTQFMQVGAQFSLSDFDASKSSGSVTQSNADTLFLYPTNSGSNTTVVPFTRDLRANGATPTAQASNATAPYPATCVATTIDAGTYACKTILALPDPIGGGASASAFLRLTSFYVGSHVRVTMLDASGNEVLFNAVQPIVDATGRANDVFRRVESRVNLYDTSFPYPEAAVDLTGNFCKDFGVTKPNPSAAQYKDGFIPGSCTP